jgi:hypothetical protein
MGSSACEARYREAMGFLPLQLFVDPTPQISVLRKLKLASCARPGNHAGFFHARGPREAATLTRNAKGAGGGWVRFAHSSGTIVQISLLGKLKPADLGLAEIGLLVRKSGAARA